MNRAVPKAMKALGSIETSVAIDVTPLGCDKVTIAPDGGGGAA